MKLCKDCEYFSESNYCHAPENGISPVTGDPNVKFATTNRRDKSLRLVREAGANFGCGPDGAFWKQKTNLVKKSWWKFWN
jgi:hypothetical protein